MPRKRPTWCSSLGAAGFEPSCRRLKTSLKGRPDHATGNVTGPRYEPPKVLAISCGSAVVPEEGFPLLLQPPIFLRHPFPLRNPPLHRHEQTKWRRIDETRLRSL